MTLTPTRAHEHTVIQDAVRELMRRIPELTDRLIACLRDGAGPDELRLVSSPAFRASAQTGLRAVLEAVASVGRERPDMPFARQVGRRYAERRIPLETALRTYRLAGTLLWESMVDVITARQDDLKANPQKYTNFLKGIYKAIALYETNPDEFIKLAAPHYNLSEAEVKEILDTSLGYTNLTETRELIGTKDKPGTLYGIFDTVMDLNIENGAADNKLNAATQIDPSPLAGVSE